MVHSALWLHDKHGTPFPAGLHVRHARVYRKRDAHTNGCANHWTILTICVSPGTKVCGTPRLLILAHRTPPSTWEHTRK